MILVLAGTQDGREIAVRLTQRGEAVIASVVSSYGRQLLESAALTINDRPLPKTQLKSFLLKNGITAVIDATHPYATHISQTAMQTAAEISVRYIRYERAATAASCYDKLLFAADYPAAAKAAAALGKTIFLTTGSRNLQLFAAAPELCDKTLIARVLPEPEVLAHCRALGLSPRQIVAMQGPFSHELNREMYKKYQADVIITKDSGTVGGTDTKLTAAMELCLPVVMIERPKLSYPCIASSYEELVALLDENNATISKSFIKK